MNLLPLNELTKGLLARIENDSVFVPLSHLETTITPKNIFFFESAEDFCSGFLIHNQKSYPLINRSKLQSHWSNQVNGDSAQVLLLQNGLAFLVDEMIHIEEKSYSAIESEAIQTVGAVQHLNLFSSALQNLLQQVSQPVSVLLLTIDNERYSIETSILHSMVATETSELQKNSDQTYEHPSAPGIPIYSFNSNTPDPRSVILYLTLSDQTNYGVLLPEASLTLSNPPVSKAVITTGSTSSALPFICGFSNINGQKPVPLIQVDALYSHLYSLNSTADHSLAAA